MTWWRSKAYCPSFHRATAMSRWTPKGGGLRYHADLGYSGPDEFGFILADGTDPQKGSTVRVVVVERPDSPFAPVAVPDEVTMEVSEARFIDVLANDSDPEDDELTLVDDRPDTPAVVSSDDAVVEVRQNQIWFEAPDGIPADQESRWINLTYQVTDGANQPVQGLVRVRVLPARLRRAGPAGGGR